MTNVAVFDVDPARSPASTARRLRQYCEVMKEEQNPAAEVVADLVGLGARLEAQSEVLNDPSFNAWYVDGGWRWLGFLTPRRIPLMGVYLLRRAARIRPAWVDPAAVDLADPLAGQLLELAEMSTRGIEAE